MGLVKVDLDMPNYLNFNNKPKECFPNFMNGLNKDEKIKMAMIRWNNLLMKNKSIKNL
jgi:hypothetical protein